MSDAEKARRAAEQFPDAVEVYGCDGDTMSPAEVDAVMAAAFPALSDAVAAARGPIRELRDVETIGGLARAVVAAVRPVIAAETLTALADDLDRHGMNGIDIRHLRARAGYAISHPRQTGETRG